MTLVTAPKPGKDDVRNLAGQHPLDGARVSNILPGLVDEMGLDAMDGVVVLSVRRASTAARLGFQPGDIIAQIGGQPVTTVADLEARLEMRQPLWLVAVKRGDKVFNLQVPG
jgi:S1-C subfamily serine protease